MKIKAYLKLSSNEEVPTQQKSLHHVCYAPRKYKPARSSLILVRRTRQLHPPCRSSALWHTLQRQFQLPSSRSDPQPRQPLQRWVLQPAGQFCSKRSVFQVRFIHSQPSNYQPSSSVCAIPGLFMFYTVKHYSEASISILEHVCKISLAQGDTKGQGR